MPIIATAGDSKSYTPAPEGTHQAVCVDVIDIGLKPNPFKDGAMQHKIDIAWQIDETRDDGKRHVLYKRYTLSLNERRRCAMTSKAGVGSRSRAMRRWASTWNPSSARTAC